MSSNEMNMVAEPAAPAAPVAPAAPAVPATTVPVGPSYRANIPEYHPTGTATSDTRIVHIVETAAVHEIARAYASGVAWTKRHHEKALDHPVPHAALLIVVTSLAQPPYTPRALLLYTRTLRGSVQLVHTRSEWTRRGYATALARAVCDRVPPRGSLSVDSPACTALTAVKLWLRVFFMGDEQLLKCELAGDSAYNGGRSVRLSFVWRAVVTEGDEDARLRFLALVAQKHPALAQVCREASVRRV
jgi:hypothetical protein